MKNVFVQKDPFLNYYMTITSLLFNKMDYRSIDSSRVKEYFTFVHQL